MDEEKIEDYLKKQGISSMQETGPKKVVGARCVVFIPASQHGMNMRWTTNVDFNCIIPSADCGSVLAAVAGSKEEEAKWAEEETLQDSQQPFGGSTGGLFRRCSCKEVKSLTSWL